MATITAIKNGNLNTASTWDLARVPIPGDLIVTAGFNVVYNPDFPSVVNVLNTDTVDNAVGTYSHPLEATVQAGVYYGPASALLGTYPAIAASGQTIQQKIDAILTGIFAGEIYYIQHPATDGSEVAGTYCVHSIISGDPLQDIEGDIEATQIRVQISIYTVNSSDLIAKAAAVTLAMRAAAILAQSNDPETTETALFNYSAAAAFDGYEEETKRFFSHLDFYCWMNNT